jgi:two-component SAPR family response regulator
VGFETEAREGQRLSLRLLGPPEASLDGYPPLRFRRKKVLALLCYLAAEGGRHSRRELAELLWPDSDEPHARADLRATMSKLRKTLGEDPVHDGEVARFFFIEADLLGIEPREVALDLEALEAAVSLARRETSLGGRRADDTAGRRELIGQLQGDLGLYRASSWRSSRLRTLPSSSCGSRLSAGGGALFSGSSARDSLALKWRRV